jgi:2-polyprenyl-6-methoxyphenol hydroxylase-like FAD-dependent oxidoreductase
MSTPLRVLVIGGSLGGLLAANLLHRIGCDVTIFERAEDDLASRGAGVSAHDELLGVMRRIGLVVDKTIGVEVNTRICLDRSGRITHRTEMPQFMSAWGRIYRLLKEAFPAARYRFREQLERVEQDAGGVTAVFAGGACVRGDLLVAADGLRSTVRAQLMPEAVPRYAGYVAWRGVSDERDIPPAIHAEIFERYTFCLPEGEMLLSYPVPGRNDDTRPGHRGYNFVWYRPTDEHTLLALCTDAAGRKHGVSIPPPLIRPELIAEIKVKARAVLAPQIAEIIERTAEPFFHAIFDLESPRLVCGRVALLGDAAFVARPHVGMGIAKAGLDAQSLTDAIAAASGDIGTALARYEHERRPFGTAIVARARHLGAYLQAQLKPRAERREVELHQQPEVVMREIGSPLVDIRELSSTPV